MTTLAGIAGNAGFDSALSASPNITSAHYYSSEFTFAHTSSAQTKPAKAAIPADAKLIRWQSMTSNASRPRRMRRNQRG